MAVVEVAPGQLTVSGALTFATVLEVRKQGEALIAKGPDVVNIDFSEVTQSGSPAVSLMMCWLRVANESKRQISYTGVPDLLQGIIDVSGLGELLSLINNQSKATK